MARKSKARLVFGVIAGLATIVISFVVGNIVINLNALFLAWLGIESEMAQLWISFVLFTMILIILGFSVKGILREVGLIRRVPKR